jgi:hypothetical protein
VTADGEELVFDVQNQGNHRVSIVTKAEVAADDSVLPSSSITLADTGSSIPVASSITLEADRLNISGLTAYEALADREFYLYYSAETLVPSWTRLGNTPVFTVPYTGTGDTTHAALNNVAVPGYNDNVVTLQARGKNWDGTILVSTDVTLVFDN